MMEQITEVRRLRFEFYQEQLAPLEAQGLLRLPHVPADCQSNHHLFYVILGSQAARDGLIEHLMGQEILAVFHYVPLHSSPVGLQFGYHEGDLPVTEELSRRLLRLPLFHEITNAEQTRVVDQIRHYLHKNAKAAGTLAA